MFDSVQYVRSLCEQRKIAVSRLEKDCGFSNGYLNPKKINRISYDRAVTIAEYLGVTVDSIMNGEEEIKNPPSKIELTERESRILEALRSKTPAEQAAFFTLLGISED